MIPYISFSVLTKLLGTVLFVQNYQAAIIFNNIARYLDFGRVTSTDYTFPWQSSGCSQYKYEWGILQNNSN